MAVAAAVRAAGARSARRSRATRERVIARHELQYRTRLDRYFSGFYRRVAPTCAKIAAEIKLGKSGDLVIMEKIYAELGRYSWDQEARILSRETSRVLIGTMEDGWKLASSEVGGGISFDLNARPVQSVLGGVGTRIRQVEDTSRQRIARMMADGIEKGLSVEQIVRGVPPGTMSVRGPIPAFPGIAGLVDSWKSTGTPGFRGPGVDAGSRSYLIARTEVANAYNLAAVDAYKSSGVDFVEVFDGQDCGWSSHDSPDMAHGSIRSVEDAGRQPISHPRCQRAFAARVDATAAAPSPYTADRARGGSVPGATPGIGAVDPLDADAIAHAGYQKVARPTPEVAEAAQRQWERARVAEPEISSALRNVTDGRMVTFEEAMAELAAAPGGDLAGYAARRKTLTSLSRKIVGDMEDAATKGKPIATADLAAKAIGDTVRYTVRFTEAEYAAGARSVAEKLIAGGNRPLPGKWKVKWADSIDRGYRGINSNWISPNGTVFEVQVHTPRSFYVKEINHPKYEIARLPTTPVEVSTRLYDEMHELAITAEIPPGLETVTQAWVDDLYRSVTSGVARTVEAVVKPAPLDVFADDAVTAARARLEAGKAYYRATGKGNDELIAAQKAVDDAIREAIARARERIRTMTTEEAKVALRDVKEQIAALNAKISGGTSTNPLLQRLESIVASGGIQANLELRLVRDTLEQRVAELTRRLPFEERVLPRPARAGARQVAYDEAYAIVKALEELVPGSSSAWTGEIRIGGAGRNAAAAFDWDQAIVIARRTTGYSEKNRLKVMIHELMHSISPDLSPAAYRVGHGWEEGVAEGMTQYLEARVRQILGRPADTPAYGAYKRYVMAFRNVQMELAMGDGDFWPALIRVPAQEREALIAGWIERAKRTAGEFERERLDKTWARLRAIAKLDNKYGR